MANPGANAGGYAGDIGSREAWEVLAREPKAKLVDVRTVPEWTFIGVPDLSSLNKRTVCVCWQGYPDMAVNPRFAEQVAEAGVGPEDTVLLLCRSGQRSRNAAQALTSLGYRTCYNVADGFEGGHDEHGHRGTREGWKVAELPWRQG